MTSVYRTAEGQAAVEASYLALLERWLPAVRRHRLATREGETFVIGWGRRKLMEQIASKPEQAPSAQHEVIGRFSELIFRHFWPRTAPLPQIGGAALERLTMPVLAILGGRDVFIDTHGARRMLEAHIQHLTVHFLPEGLHFIPGQAGLVGRFLADGPK